MYPVPAPPSSGLPEEEKEHHEKTPVFKKVMDKMKRMKKAIRKKTHGHGNGGDVDDHLHDGELDEGDEEYEEDEEIKEDPAVHDVPTPKDYESPSIGATIGAKENSVGGGERDGLRLTTEKFVGDLDPPTTEAETNISRGSEREGAEGVGDGLGMINEESVEDSGVRGAEGEGNLGIEQSRGFPSYESPATVAKTGANDILGGGGEGDERVNNGMVDAEMNTRNEKSRDSPFNMSGGLGGAKGVDHFVKDPALPRTDDETDMRNEESQVYGSSAAGAKTGANELLGVESAKGVDDSSGLITKDFVENPAIPRTNDETDTRIEQSQVYESLATVAKTGVNDISGGGGEGAERVNDGMADAETNTRNEQSRDSSFNMSGGLEGAKGVNHFVKDPASPRTDDEMDTRNEESQVYESSATGVKTRENVLLGVESAKGVDDGSGLITKDFVENSATPRTNDEIDTRIEQSQAYESPTTVAKIRANDISGGGGEGAERVDDGMADDEINTRNEQNRDSPFNMSGGLEGAKGVDHLVKDSISPRIDDETDMRNEESQVYESPAAVAKIGAEDISGGGGEDAERLNDGMADAEMNTRNEQSRDFPFNLSGGLEGAKGVDDFVKNQASPRIDDETDTRNEQSRVYESSATSAKTGANELLGVESAKGVDDDSGFITKDFVENPTTPRTNDETDTRIEQSQVYESPVIGAKIGANDILGGGGEDVERVNDGMADAETNTRNEQSRNSPFNMSEELEGAKGVDHFAKDSTSPRTDDEMYTRTEESQGGEAVEAAPELRRSLEAMAISPQSEKGETELSKDKNNGYAGMVSSVKPDSGKEGEGEGEVGGKQGKGISIKEYFTGKLTPGEDERALSELITEGGQSKKNAAVEVPPPVGVMGKIRDTITSFLGGGESSPKSPATEAGKKVAEDDNVFLRRTPEATSHEKKSSEELPSSYN